MQSVDFYSVQRLSEDFYAIARKFPEERKHLMEELAGVIQSTVAGNIGGAGKVQSWQDKFIGSGGGYAAVRAKAKVKHKGYAVGYITNAIENGHEVSKPSGYAKRYRPRLKKTRVPGKGFYAKSRGGVETAATQAAQNLMERLAAELEG